MSRLVQTARATAAISLMLLIGVLAGACAHKPGAKTSDGYSAKPMDTVSEAEAALDAAEKELGDMILIAGAAPVPAAPVPGSPVAEPRPSPAPNENRPQVEFSHLAKADRCSRACHALASMQRAAERLCELAGEGDTRCKSARSRVTAARDVVQAACPDCSA